MTYTYLDTSALVKIYLDEPGSARAIELLRDVQAQARRLFVASIGFPEAISALGG